MLRVPAGDTHSPAAAFVLVEEATAPRTSASVAARQGNQSLPRTGYGVSFAPIVQLAIPVGLGMVVQHALQLLLGMPPLVRNTVRGDVSRATATREALHPSSVLSRMRARLMTRAKYRPLRINRSSWARSSDDNRTAYFS